MARGATGCGEAAETDGKPLWVDGGGLGVCVADRGGCVLSVCGDGFVDQLASEVCDDGDTERLLVRLRRDLHRSWKHLWRWPGSVAARSVTTDNGGPGDGCTPTGTVQSGWTCDTQQPSRCTFGHDVVVNAGTFIMGSPATEEGRQPD